MKKFLFVLVCIVAIIISCCFDKPRETYYEMSCPITKIDTIQQWDPVRQVHVDKYKVNILLNDSTKRSIIMSRCPQEDSLIVYI